MDTEGHQQLVRSYFEARNRNDDSDERFLSPDFERRSPPELRGLAEYRAWKAALRRMWSDERWEVLGLAAADDRVWVHLSNESTHAGEWNGLPATGKRVRFETVNILRIEAGRIAEMWRVADDWSRVRQLGGSVAWPAQVRQ
jgi:predicted ester cyclase